MHQQKTSESRLLSLTQNGLLESGGAHTDDFFLPFFQSRLPRLDILFTTVVPKALERRLRAQDPLAQLAERAKAR
jgi:hypothetical protein